MWEEQSPTGRLAVNVLKVFGVVMLGIFVLFAMIAYVEYSDAQTAATGQGPIRSAIGSAVDTAVNTVSPPPVVTLGEYLRIKDGMTYDQVAGIIGADGVEISRTSLGGITAVMYSWVNPGGSNMIAMFQDRHLVSKGHFGLKD